MSGDNGGIKPQEDEIPESIEMRIVLEIGKPCKVYYPLLADKVMTYRFLKLAEKTLDKHYEEQEKPAIIQPKGGIKVPL